MNWRVHIYVAAAFGNTHGSTYMYLFYVIRIRLLLRMWNHCSLRLAPLVLSIYLVFHYRSFWNVFWYTLQRPLLQSSAVCMKYDLIDLYTVDCTCTWISHWYFVWHFQMDRLNDSYAPGELPRITLSIAAVTAASKLHTWPFAILLICVIDFRISIICGSS